MSNKTVYITDHSPSVLQTHSWRTATNSAAYLVPYIKPSMEILDIGCGPGSISVDFARLVPQGHVTGIEYVADPLDTARSLASAQGITNIDFRVGDIHSLDFPDDTFDIVHVHQVLQHIADPVRALREMRRVAKSDGGIVAARESASMTWYPDNAGIAGWKEVTGRMGKAKGGNPHPGRYIHVWAEEAEFKRTRIKKSAGAWCFSSPEGREYWGGSMEARMRSSGFSKMAVEEGYTTKEELERVANGWRDFVKNDQAWFGLFHGEILCWK
jgi:ubiquinone/menaquinone biosynthesis C-methylase UbiE